MSDATAPGTPAAVGLVPGVGVSTEPTGWSRSGRAPTDAIAQFLPHGAPPAAGSATVAQAVARASRPDYAVWLTRTASAAGCVRPVRLAGSDCLGGH